MGVGVGVAVSHSGSSITSFESSCKYNVMKVRLASKVIDNTFFINVKVTELFNILFSMVLVPRNLLAVPKLVLSGTQSIAHRTMKIYCEITSSPDSSSFRRLTTGVLLGMNVPCPVSCPIAFYNNMTNSINKCILRVVILRSTQNSLCFISTVGLSPNSKIAYVSTLIRISGDNKTSILAIHNFLSSVKSFQVHDDQKLFCMCVCVSVFCEYLVSTIFGNETSIRQPV